MPRVKTDEKQDTILEAASQVFSAKEFHEVLIEEIAASAEVGKGTVYRYFRTKEDLYFSTILRGLDRLHEILSAALPQEPSPERRLERIAREWLTVFWNRRSLLMLLYRDERRLTARREELRNRRDRILRLVQGVLVQGIEQRQFRGVNPRTAAELFLAMIRGMNLFRRDEDTVEGLVAEMVGIFTLGIARRQDA